MTNMTQPNVVRALRRCFVSVSHILDNVTALTHYTRDAWRCSLERSWRICTAKIWKVELTTYKPRLKRMLYEGTKKNTMDINHHYFPRVKQHQQLSSVKCIDRLKNKSLVVFRQLYRKRTRVSKHLSTRLTAVTDGGCDMGYLDV